MNFLADEGIDKPIVDLLRSNGFDVIYILETNQGAGQQSKQKVLWLWAGTALLLSVCAILGNLLLENVADPVINYIRCFAAGAVVASLAIEVFPKAFKKDNYWAGISTILGLVLAYYLNSLGK